MYMASRTVAVRLMTPLLVAILALPAFGIQAVAANGDQLRQIIADRTGTACVSIDAAGNHGNVGTGIAFDGTNLLMGCWDSTITVLNPANGAQVSHYTVAGASTLGALAYDAGRNVIWGCSSYSSVGTIDPGTHVFTFKFSTPGCLDGLAYDAKDDTIWTSPDATGSVTHTKADGTHLSTTSIPINNSGIAVGGSTLYLANDGGQQIYTSPKDFSTPLVLFASFPRRIEDMECDDVSFAAAGKGAIWSMDAYDNVLNAWEIPAGSCSFGGGAPKDTTPPTCVLTGVIAGPPKQLQITVQDTGSGLKSVIASTAVNASVSVPAFAAGTTSALVVTATKIDQSLGAQVGLTVTDVAGNVTVCDPVMTTVVRSKGQPSSETFNNLAKAESKITLLNGTPGMDELAIVVNGKRFNVDSLNDGATKTIDVASAMHAGTTNTIVVRAHGDRNASITIVIHD